MRYALVLTLLLAACAPTRSTPPDGSNPPSGSDLPALASGWYFGECGGDCQGRLELDPDGSFVFETFGWQNEVYLSVAGTLTDDTLADIEEGYDELDRSGLESVYGCPDCDDGGGEYVEFASGVDPLRVDWEFGNSPEELKGLTSWLDQVEQAARQCNGSSGLITIDLCDGGDIDGDGGDDGNDTDPEPPPPGR